MSKRSLNGKDHCINKKVSTPIDVTPITRRDPKKRQSISDTCIEYDIYKATKKNGNQNNFFYDSIITHKLSASEINTTFMFFIDNFSNEFLDQVISSTLSKWNILDFVKKSTEMKELLGFFTNKLRFFQKVLYNEQNNDGENLLHILSNMEDLTILSYFMENLDEHIRTEPSIKFLKSTRRDGSNFFHVICSRQFTNPEMFLDVIAILQKKFGKQMIVELVKAKTNQGEDLFDVISKSQNKETISQIWDWFMNGYEDIVEAIAKTRKNDGKNIPQTKFELNLRAQKSIPCVINVDIGENSVLEDLLKKKSKNKNKNNLCHKAFGANRSIFSDILQMKELDKDLNEKMFSLPESNNERDMDKLCNNLKHFPNAASKVHNKHELDITRSKLYNIDPIGNPVLLKTMKANEMDIAHQKHDHNVISDVMNSRNNKQNFIKKLCSNSSPVSFVEVLKLLFDKLEKKAVEQLLLSKDKNGNTFLHFLCRQNDEIQFKEFLEFLFDKLEQNVVEEILLSKGTHL